ncbi:hypothetical protein MNBD_CHLOROFLEXI01-1840 [hydrothermal vent metagenome]|uniref:Uncharacterized protein n=1 Tax=hydrothermal vent metagenome TaxID=652676 RepID=A0A3B0V2N1_9ZZZZ
MNEQLEERLQQLQQEYESGQTMLTDLQAKETDLQQTLLRISGAMQVLQEMLQGEEVPALNGAVLEETAVEAAISD